MAFWPAATAASVSAMPVAASSGGLPGWVSFFSAMVGGGVVGSLVSTYVTASREGRAARAKVLTCVSAVESTRWADVDFAQFRQALSELEAAALVARAPRQLVLLYGYMAEVAHYTEVAKRQEYPQWPPRSLPAKLSELVAVTKESLVEQLRHPWMGRLRVGRRQRRRWLRKLSDLIATHREEFPDWAWVTGPLVPKLTPEEPGPLVHLRHRLSHLGARVAWPRRRQQHLAAGRDRSAS